MRPITKTLRILMFSAFVTGAGQLFAQMDKQSVCAAKVHADMEATREKSPDVVKTIRSYTFEYSRSSQSCVIIMQYNTEDKAHGKMVQILAINAFTMQPMENHENVFLVQPSQSAEIENAANFLFKKYSH
jgi:hypothetical protein